MRHRNLAQGSSGLAGEQRCALLYHAESGHACRKMIYLEVARLGAHRLSPSDGLPTNERFDGPISAHI